MYNKLYKVISNQELSHSNLKENDWNFPDLGIIPKRNLHFVIKT